MPAVKRKFPPVSALAKNVLPEAKKPKPASNQVASIASDEDESEDDLDVSDYSSEEESAGSVEALDQETDNHEEPQVVVTKRKPLPLDPHKSEASREAHLKQKAQLQERRAQKPHADTLARSKALWAQLNKKKVPKAKRQEVIEELYSLVSGSVVEIIFKHDASRVIQACFKYGSEAQRTTILSELKGRLVELSKSIYGKFLVVKMLYYGSPAHRDAILSEVHGNVRKLIKHKEAAYVVEDAFRDYTTPAQQEALVSEMYGAEFSVFESTGSKTLAELLTESPEKRDTIMKNLWESISGSVKKGSIGFTIIHRALLSFLTNANGPEKSECVELIKEQLPEIVHTKDGSHVASLIMALSTAKDRKVIMKSFREHITKAMTDEYGWQSIIALFMTVDDTVLLTKAFSPDISTAMLSLFEDRNARKVLLYLLGDLQPRYFTAPQLALFETVNQWKSTTSKKPDGVRRAEILNSLSDAMVSTLLENLDGMIKDPNASSLLIEILLHAPTDREEAVTSLAARIGSPESMTLEHVPRVLKSLVQEGWYDKTTRKVQKVTPSIHFAAKFAPSVLDRIVDWSTGPGSFVVVALLESTEDTALIEKLKEGVKAHRDRVEEAAEKGNKGSKLLLKMV